MSGQVKDFAHSSGFYRGLLVDILAVPFCIEALVGELDFEGRTDIIRRKAPGAILARKKHGAKKTHPVLSGCIFYGRSCFHTLLFGRLLAQRTGIRTMPIYEEGNAKQ